MVGRTVDCFHLCNRGRLGCLRNILPTCHMFPYFIVSQFPVQADSAFDVLPQYLRWHGHIAGGLWALGTAHLVSRGDGQTPSPGTSSQAFSVSVSLFAWSLSPLQPGLFIDTVSSWCCSLLWSLTHDFSRKA